jgi:tetratricopeptide (TPR) repeat protein
VKSSWEGYSEETRESEAPPQLTLEELYTPPPTPLEQVQWEEIWSVLTEPRQLGLGEGLATEVWREEDFRSETARPKSLTSPSGKSPARLQLGAAERKLRTWASGETKEIFPALRIDGRRLDHFIQVKEIRQKSHRALIDPYTELICEFREADRQSLAWERGKTGAYAFSSGANRKIGQLQLAEWNLRGAEASFRRALKADAHDPDLWWHLGIVKLLRRKSRAAQKAFQQALDHRASELRSQLGLGLAYYHERQYAKAEDCFARAKGPDRRGVGARSFLACCYRLQKKFPQALSEIHHLESSEIPAWREMAKQCRRCVVRGEEQTGQKRTWRFWTALAGSVGFIILAVADRIYETLRDLPARQGDWQEWGMSLAFLLLILGFARKEIMHSLKQKFQEQEGAFGEGKESLPCWQTRAWMRPHKLDIFGHSLPIPRK